MTKKLPIAAAIFLGVALVIAQAVLQAVSLPTAVVALLAPIIVLLATYYGVGAAATAALIRSRISPHLVALITTALGGGTALLATVSVGSLLRIVIAVVLTIVGTLLPGSLIGPAASEPIPATGSTIGAPAAGAVAPAGSPQAVPPPPPPPPPPAPGAPTGV